MKSDYNTGTAMLLLITVSVLFYPCLHGKAAKKCERGFYFDEITEKCDPCYDICHRAEQHGTRRECRSLCPGFTDVTDSPQKCQHNWYLDRTVDRCEPCHSLCRHAHIRGQEQQCQEQCPDWKRKQGHSTPAQEVPDQKEAFQQNTPLLWAPIVIGVLTLACGGLMFWFRQEIVSKLKNICLCCSRSKPRRSHQVVTEESTCRYEPVIGSCPGPTLRETTV